MTDTGDIAMPIGCKLSVGPSTPPPPTILIQNPLTSRHLLSVHPDGTVTGEIEDASEAARVFVENIRRMVAMPMRGDVVRDQLLQECLVKLRDVQGTQAPKQYACNLIKRIEKVLGNQSQ